MMAPANREKSEAEKGALPPLPDKEDLGTILLRHGAITRAQLEECLRQQGRMALTPGSRVPRLGELLVHKGYVTPEAIHRALREQEKKILHCPCCNILINVDARPDAIGYRCGRCEGELTEPPAGSHERCVESSIIVNSRIPVPEEVRRLKDNPACRFGKYVMLGEIGRGGIASVHRAWDLYLNQYVALKRIRPVPAGSSTVRQTRVASLLNEAHNAIRLRHPNIVSVYDIGRINNEYYISMEFLDGRTMYDEVKRHRDRGEAPPFHENPRKWLGMLYQVAHAVHYAHTRPIPTFHCDLKPGNIFITKDEVPYVLDFGLARHVGDIETERGTVCGTPAYMSPEQASGRNDEIDARTDVYGLGAVLYELLAGQPPFLGDMGEVLRKTVTEMPVPPSEVRRGVRPERPSASRLALVPPEIEALCMRCLRKDRDERPQSALEFAREIEAVAAGGRSSLPRPDSTRIGLAFAEPAAPAPPPLPPPPAPRRVGILTWTLLGLAVMTLGGWASWRLAPFFQRHLDKEAPVYRASQLLADFRPEAVQEIEDELRGRPEAVDLIHQMHQISALKHRLIAAISERKPVVTNLTVGSRVLPRVLVARAKLGGIVYMIEDEVDEAAWTELGATGIVAVARASGILEESPENRYALALYCRSAGAQGAARDLFRSLEGTWLANAAQRYLSDPPPER